MLRIKELSIIESQDALNTIPEGKVLINTINAHSFNVAQKMSSLPKLLLKVIT